MTFHHQKQCFIRVFAIQLVHLRFHVVSTFTSEYLYKHKHLR
jgi:hypothetical protein